MPVAGLRPRHREIGRLRLGVAEPIKGKKGSKIRALDTWRITTSHLEVIGVAARLWGGVVTEGEGGYDLVTEVDTLQVFVPEQDITAGQWLEEWSAAGILHRCDGVTDLISDSVCLRDAEEPCKCQITSHLLVVLPELPDLGVFRCTTRGWNAAAELPEAVRMVQMIGATGALPHAELGIEHRTKRVGGETHSFVVPILRLPYTLSEVHGFGDRPSLPPAGVDPETGEIRSALPLPAEAESPAATDDRHTLGKDVSQSDAAAGTTSAEADAEDAPDPEAEATSHEDGSRAGEAEPASGSGGPDGAPATEAQWALATSRGITAAKAVRESKRLGIAVRSASELTQGQLARIIEELVGSGAAS